MPTNQSIEDIILDRDRRGLSKLREHLPADFCDQAASLVLRRPGTVLIVTGFYILAGGGAETDGPPGAIAIGNALRSLGYNVVYVTDRYTVPFLEGHDAPVVDFPITDDESSRRFAAELLGRLAPSLLIAIERCGPTHESLYRNMHGQDISQYNARIDHLFNDFPYSVGIGDGGNEIGMGILKDEIPEIPTLVKLPCVTFTTQLIVTSVSNWGGYGLVAAISRRTGRNLLPTVEREEQLIKSMVDMGAVDGFTNKPEYKVDGFPLEENSITLARLRELLATDGIAGG